MRLLSDWLNKMSAEIWLELPERNAFVGLHLADPEMIYIVGVMTTQTSEHTHT